MSDETPDDLDDFLAELDQELKTPGSAKSPRKVAPTWSGPVVQINWIPSRVVLHIAQQTCACGCQAESVTGLFLEYTTRNGNLRLTRTTLSKIPLEFFPFPRELEYTYENIEVCPACFTSKEL